MKISGKNQVHLQLNELAQHIKDLPVLSDRVIVLDGENCVGEAHSRNRNRSSYNKLCDETIELKRV